MDTVTWDEQRQEFVDPNKAVFLSRPTWVPDAEVTHCKGCLSEFGWTNRKHHCRCCGCIFCANCSRYRMELPPDFGYKGPERVCLDCYAVRNQVAPATQSVQIKQKQEEDNLLIRFFVRDQNEYQFDKMDCDMIRRTTHKSICFMGHTKPDGNFLLICSICDSSNPPIELLTELGSKFFRFILEKIDHPYISKPDVTAFMTDAHKAIVMRLYSKMGSIRDLIYKISNPRTHFEKKYVLGKGKPLDIKSIAKYGRMVLEALMYLKKVGFPYPHLHAGNVLVSPDKSKCWISDQENCLLGYTPYYQLEYPHVEAEVECFGHLLYEMALGSLRPSKKTSATPIAVPSTCPKAISEILDAIFLGESSPMTVERLLEDPFFVNVEGLPTIQTTLPKMKPAAKQMLETIKNRTNEMVSCIRSGTPVPQYQSSDLEAAGLTSPKQRSTRKSVAPASSSSSSSSSSSAQPISSVASPPPVARAASVASISSASPPAASRSTPAPTPVLTTSSSSSSISRPAVSSSPSSGGAISSSPSSAPPSAPTPPPAPAPPPAPSPPPPPPASLAAALPPPQGGRSALLDAIKNPANAKKLKKVDKSKLEKKASLAAAAGGGAADAPKSSGNSMQDALMARFAAMNKNKN